VASSVHQSLAAGRAATTAASAEKAALTAAAAGAGKSNDQLVNLLAEREQAVEELSTRFEDQQGRHEVAQAGYSVLITSCRSYHAQTHCNDLVVHIQFTSNDIKMTRIQCSPRL
jgi:hypothetical protein